MTDITQEGVKLLTWRWRVWPAAIALLSLTIRRRSFLCVFVFAVLAMFFLLTLFD